MLKFHLHNLLIILIRYKKYTFLETNKNCLGFIMFFLFNKTNSTEGNNLINRILKGRLSFNHLG